METGRFQVEGEALLLLQLAIKRLEFVIGIDQVILRLPVIFVSFSRDPKGSAEARAPLRVAAKRSILPIRIGPEVRAPLRVAAKRSILPIRIGPEGKQLSLNRSANVLPVQLAE